MKKKSLVLVALLLVTVMTLSSCAMVNRVKDFFGNIFNPKVELTAMRGEDWIRITCEANLETNHEAVVSMVEAHPHLAQFYRADDPDTEVFYLANATATIFSTTPEPLTIQW